MSEGRCCGRPWVDVQGVHCVTFSYLESMKHCRMSSSLTWLSRRAWMMRAKMRESSARALRSSAWRVRPLQSAVAEHSMALSELDILSLAAP